VAPRPTFNQTIRNTEEVAVPKLVIFRGDAVESEMKLTGQTLRVGRHNHNDVVLDDGLNGVSRFHAEIRPEGGGYVIVDLNSRNGVWLRGRRINERAALALGVPATVGAFELTLEDDVPTGEFRDAGPGQRTVVTSPTDRKDATGRSGTRSPTVTGGQRQPVTPARRQMLVWSGAAAAVVLSCVVTYVVVKALTRRNPPPSAVTVAELPTPVPVRDVDLPRSASPEDPNKPLNERDLSDARTLIAERQYEAALRDHVQPVLERDPDNADALELKRQIEQLIPGVQPRPTKVPKEGQLPPVSVDVPGIARRPNEAEPDYLNRVRRIQVAYADGKSSFDKLDYAKAIAHFRAVEREQPKYQDVDVLLANVVSQQQKALEDAIRKGQQSEQGNYLKLARQWYQQALVIDPDSATARERNASVLGRMNSEAQKLFNAATAAEKQGETAVAIQQFQQILDLMLPGDELRERAAKELEVLKR
jgi:pSer/pThr/pTyr-binding forkhead associated (FHA) protein/tetratricopeptide (TPR) repeat protein